LRLDPGWLGARGHPGWSLLPLRAFLGLTFSYAGLQKLANPGYLNARNPTSVAHQMLVLRHTSPIGPLLGLSVHAPTLIGLTVAFGELAVGVGTLLGLVARVAAAGGALLALTFFLTVSWNTRPYYYGADIVFFFAWLVMLAFGSGGVFSLDGWLRDRARRDLRLAPEPATVAVAVPRLRRLCARGSKCGLAPDGQCTRPVGCPVFPVRERLPARVGEDLDRRVVMLSGAAAAVVGVLAVLGGALAAVAGRAIGGTGGSPRAAAAPPASTAGSGSSPPLAGQQGTAVAAASSVPVGQAVSFTNPADGSPGWVVHPSADTFVAFSATCTHAGCQVRYDPSTVQFLCPCHGGVYDARTGQVLQGPPPSALPAIPVHLSNDQVRVG
jgi:thiosulfate dehydrogenase [quinone] large subunit